MPITDKSIELTSKDSHKLGAYVVHPEKNKKGNIVIIQEIFGITEHIEAVCRQYANQGYSVIAPALYDRFEKNIVLDYSQIEEGKSFKEKLEINDAMKDINAAILFNDGPTAIKNQSVLLVIMEDLLLKNILIKNLNVQSCIILVNKILQYL